MHYLFILGFTIASFVCVIRHRISSAVLLILVSVFIFIPRTRSLYNEILNKKISNSVKYTTIEFKYQDCDSPTKNLTGWAYTNCVFYNSEQKKLELAQIKESKKDISKIKYDFFDYLELISEMALMILFSSLSFITTEAAAFYVNAEKSVSLPESQSIEKLRSLWREEAENYFRKGLSAAETYRKLSAKYSAFSSEKIYTEKSVSEMFRSLRSTSEKTGLHLVKTSERRKKA